MTRPESAQSPSARVSWLRPELIAPWWDIALVVVGIFGI